ncbi:tetratricopeptide repeat protein [Portibacter marinus]|uniref:tetratricopeptide repeat protein n=1 Tax=Portibacter marinus TaxID=2898660 RepID=UPI001F2D9486|nr:tetratricopeptide repeat protein [Portibacter marinus]
MAVLVFLPSLQNEFVNWDDDRNFYDNTFVVHSVDFASLIANTPAIFSTPIIGNYNPLSIWTFALENVIYGLDQPFYWHLDNLLLHLLCIFFVFRISIALGLNLWASVICTLLFAIHPMKVESVAWVTERKDVLFGAFYLAALYYYILGVKNKKPNQHLIKIMVLFLLSGLSKIQAVTLPLSMLAVDYLLGRKIIFKRITEKWFYFLISIFIGLLGIYFLRQQGSLNSSVDYAWYDRLFVGSFSYVVYFIKFFVPYRLIPLYPYPPQLSIIHYLSMIPAIGIVLFTIWAYIKEWKNLVFGIAFFTFNIFFLLQILGAGQGFQADRFTYIAYFGFGYALAYYLQKWASSPKNRTIINVIVSLYLVAIAYITYQQNKIWENSASLWSHVIKYHPNTTLPWGNRANYYRDSGFDRLALQDYNKAISLGENKPGPFNSRAKLFFKSQNRDTILMALRDYNQAIALEPTNGEYYMNRGATYARLNDLNSALQDLTRASELDPNNTTIYLNRSIVYHQLGQYQNEIADINRFLRLDPNNANMWANLANAQMLSGLWDLSLPNINQAIRMNPNMGVYYFYRAQYYYNTGNSAAAQQDLNQARQLGFQFNGGIENLRM